MTLKFLTAKQNKLQEIEEHLDKNWKEVDRNIEKQMTVSPQC